MARMNNLLCCGVREIHELCTYTACTAMKNIAFDILDHCAFVIFTAVVASDTTGYGANFATYITNNGLGEVMRSPTRVNPNSLNKLAVWIWTVDHKALGAWMIKEKLKAP